MVSDIFDVDLDDLPDDPELAFVEFDNRLFKAVQLDNNRADWSVERRYVWRIKAYCDEFKIGLDFRPPQSDADFRDWYTSFLDEISYHKTRITIRKQKEDRAGATTILKLNEGFRQEIYKRLDQVRAYIEASGLNDRKKDAIYAKIAALRSEVDRSKTRLDAFLSIQLDVTAAIGQSADNLEPVVNLLNAITKVFSRAKTANEQEILGKPDEQPRLEGPKPRTESSSADPDEAIPF